MTPTRPALKYPGGKWRLAPWIISHFPPHDCYVEPFAGGASVLLRKQPAIYEILNDADGDVVNFFRVLRNSPDELIRAIALTPWSREEYELANEDIDEPLERARRFYVHCHQSFSGGKGKWDSGWRYQLRTTSNKPAVRSWGEPEYLWSIVSRLKNVQIEHDSALEVIRRFDDPNTLFYVDPPYVHDTRSKWADKMYQHEMSDDDHRKLAALLHKVEGKVILSGYPSDLYTELFADWRTDTRKSRTNFTNTKTECLWLSPNVDASQLDLMHLEEVENVELPD